MTKAPRVDLPVWSSEIEALPANVKASSDFYWYIYPFPARVPNNVPEGSGVGAVGGKAVMICSQRFVLSTKGKPTTDVERRSFKPTWFQHEMAHALFNWYFPEFNLESKSHSWFDRTTWPNDFRGNRAWEADYFIEAIRRRIATASPSPAKRLSKGTTSRPTRQIPALVPWKLCAAEHGRCSFKGAAMVKYGAGERYVIRNKNNGVSCTNQVFGDPAQHVRKNCWYVPIPGTACAVEHGHCAFTGTATVRYGSNGKYVDRKATNGLRCTTAMFGRDPAPNRVKSCSLLT